MSPSSRSTVRVLLLVFVLISMPRLTYADPGAMGGFAVSESEYDFGDSAFAFLQAGAQKYSEVRGVVHYPSDMSRGKFPLVMFVHGDHDSCYTSAGQAQKNMWPCEPGWLPIPSYRGYDYLAKILASHGYIVASISVNGVSAATATPDIRGALLHHHLNLWREFNSSGGFPGNGSLFVGKVDLSNVGLMGHSKGGETVAFEVDSNQSAMDPLGIRAVLFIAPMNKYRKLIKDVHLGVLLSYCDYDVRDLQGIHYYDDARYSSDTDKTSKHTFLLMGGNHNFYNTVWTPGLFPAGTSDDWPLMFHRATGSTPVPFDATDPHCNSNEQRLTATQQRGAATAFADAFFRAYLGGEKQFFSILSGDTMPQSTRALRIFTSYHAPMDKRLDVNRLDSKARELTNTLGGGVLSSGLIVNNICGSTVGDAQCLPSEDPVRQPHTKYSSDSNRLGLSQLLLQWSSSGGWYENQLPSGARDVRVFDQMQFRAGVDFINSPPGQAQDFRVELHDGAGRIAHVRVSSYSKALFYPPGDRSLFVSFLGSEGHPTPKLLLNTVRIPLRAFASRVNLSDIRAIRFVFDQTPQGSIAISDLALTKDDRGANLTPLLRMITN